MPFVTQRTNNVGTVGTLLRIVFEESPFVFARIIVEVQLSIICYVDV